MPEGCRDRLRRTLGDPARRARIYVDGALDSAHPAATAMITNTSHLLIGNLPNGGDKFVGRIDEVAIWTRALGDAETKALYEATQSL